MASVMGLTFKNSALLDQAFVHRSYANESPIPIEDNERLEFLGDAVLNFILVAHFSIECILSLAKRNSLSCAQT